MFSKARYLGTFIGNDISGVPSKVPTLVYSLDMISQGSLIVRCLGIFIG